MACGILVPQPGIEPMSPAVEPASTALESRFLTIGPPGKSSHHVFLNSSQNTWDSSGSDGMLNFSYLDQDGHASTSQLLLLSVSLVSSFW